MRNEQQKDCWKRRRARKLRIPKTQEAFDSLIRVWNRESPAMMKSNLPIPLDALNLLANVHVRAELEWLEEKLIQNQAFLASKLRITSIEHE